MEHTELESGVLLAVPTLGWEYVNLFCLSSCAVFTALVNQLTSLLFLNLKWKGILSYAKSEFDSVCKVSFCITYVLIVKD